MQAAAHPEILLVVVEATQGEGGIARVVRTLIRILETRRRETGRGFRVFSMRGPGPEAAVADPLIGPLPRGVFRAFEGDRARMALVVLREQLVRRPALVFYDHARLARLQWLMPPGLARPYGVWIHGNEIWDLAIPGVERILRKSAVCLASSSYTARRVASDFPRLDGRITPCPLALDDEPGGEAAPAVTAVPNARETELLERIGPRAVLIVARTWAAERAKGHDELIDAWPAVLARVPDAQLVIVGKGDDLERLQAKAAASPGGQRILFTGFLSEAALDAVYHRSALFAMPSRQEGFGLVYLEAMRRRKACIGSRQDAATDVIADGETGLLVDQSDISGLSDAIAGLLLDDQRRLRMGEAGYRRCHEQFSFAQFQARVLRALGEGSRLEA